MPSWLNRLVSRLVSRDRPVVPVVRLSGAIGAAGMPIRSTIALASVEPALERAFSFKGPAVAILVNSPGGAAVQAHLIFKRIRSLAEEKHKKVIVAVEDVAASGGYMIALAGDEIVVDASSIVGSIGVVSAGFGFPALLERFGIERRVHTAGKSKAMLDPFQPEREEDVARLRAIQEDVHAAFIALVKVRRGAVLADYPDLYSGAFWSGSKAVALGLADRLGDLRSVLRERYGKNVRLRLIPTERSAWRRRLGLGAGDRLAAGFADRLIALVEERLLWGRFGL
ncbi:MAG: S49 family peptidase [Bauldia sp.]